MTRVGVCGSQSSGQLWCSICHNLTMTYSRRLTMGSSICVPPASSSNISLAGRGMNGFKHSVETFCGWPGPSSESMVTMFLAMRDTSVIIKGPIKSG
uniref:Uncharacterized protein n=1 Tax=Romanomermis culicivorax TaxID=13658 RepID=A0A915JLW7_ROMCU